MMKLTTKEAETMIEAAMDEYYDCLSFEHFMDFVHGYVQALSDTNQITSETANDLWGRYSKESATAMLKWLHKKYPMDPLSTETWNEVSQWDLT